MNLMFEALTQSIYFYPLALGVYLSYSILKTTDMTTEGSFVLGASVFARLYTLQMNPFIAILSSIILGVLAGMGVAFIQAKERIHSLIAGIIGLFILYTLNFEVMGRPNIGLHNIEVNNIVIAAIVLVITLLMVLIIASQMGLLLRAFGCNRQLLQALGKNSEHYRLFGLGLSNGLAAIAGIIYCFTNGYADLNMGFGMTLTGIGTVVIGEQLLKRFFPFATFNAVFELIATFIGVYLYFLAVNGFLSLGLNPIYLKLLLGVLLIFLLRRRKIL